MKFDRTVLIKTIWSVLHDLFRQCITYVSPVFKVHLCAVPDLAEESATYVCGFQGAAWVFSLNDSPDCAGWSSVGPFWFPGTATVFRRKPSGRPDRRPASGRPCDALPDRFHWPHDLCRHGPLPHHHCHHLHPDPDHHCLRHRLRRLQGETEAKVVRLYCYCIWIKISPRIIIIQEEEDISNAPDLSAIHVWGSKRYNKT